jgi:hypothetical protein
VSDRHLAAARLVAAEYQHSAVARRIGIQCTDDPDARRLWINTAERLLRSAYNMAQDHGTTVLWPDVEAAAKAGNVTLLKARAKALLEHVAHHTKEMA